MLYWNEIMGIKKINYSGNVENGVILPEINEEVLFCRSGYVNEAEDIYFSGHIYEGEYGLLLTNSSTRGIEDVADGIKWARFNKPKTKNNIGYAIAYLDENGMGFLKDVPNIVTVEENDIKNKIKELEEIGNINITVFSYIKPCSFQYNWDYIKDNKVIL